MHRAPRTRHPMVTWPERSGPGVLLARAGGAGALSVARRRCRFEPTRWSSRRRTGQARGGEAITVGNPTSGAMRKAQELA